MPWSLGCEVEKKEGTILKRPSLIVEHHGDILEVLAKAAYLIGDESKIKKLKEQVMETRCYGAALKYVNDYVDIRFSDGSTDGLELTPEEEEAFDRAWVSIGEELIEVDDKELTAEVNMTDENKSFQAPNVQELIESIEKPTLFYIYPSVLKRRTNIDVNELTGMMQLALENENNTQIITDTLSINTKYNLPFSGDIKVIWKIHGKRMLEIASKKLDLYFPVIELFAEHMDKQAIEELAKIVENSDDNDILTRAINGRLADKWMDIQMDKLVSKAIAKTLTKT